MNPLKGKTSDRIRSGKIPSDALNVKRLDNAEDMPSAKAIRRAEGHGMGKGATARRGGKEV